MKAVDSIGYRILDIKTLQYATFANSNDSSALKKQISLNTTFSYGVDTSKNIFSCRLDIFACNGEEPLFKIETQAIYEFKHDTIERYIKGTQFTMPINDVNHFTSILYGATRGILVCRLEKSAIRDFILPPVDLKNIITRPLNLELGDNYEI